MIENQLKKLNPSENKTQK